MITLKRISEEYTDIFRQIEEADGEITPETEQALAITRSDLEKKTEAYVDFIGSLDAQIDRYDKEIRRLNAMKKQAEHLKSWLRNNLLWAVKTFGNIQTDFHKVSLQKSETVVITEEKEVPARFKKLEQVVTIDKIALKKALKEGTVKPTATMFVQENQNLKIN